MTPVDDRPFPTGGEDEPTVRPGEEPAEDPAGDSSLQGRSSDPKSWMPSPHRGEYPPRNIPAACPACGGPTRPGYLFCLRCRHGFGTGRRPAVPTPIPVRWIAVVEVDLDYFSRHTADGLVPPADSRPRGFPLHEKEVKIGCAPQDPPPRIALSRRPGPLYDPAVSRDHAWLIRQPDGSYVIVDRNSSNGTRVNDPAVCLPPGQPQALADGDRIYLGAWTRITLYRLD